MGWTNDILGYIGNKMLGSGGKLRKDGGPIEDMMKVAGGPPDRGVKKMYGDSLFGYFKKGGHVKKFIQ